MTKARHLGTVLLALLVTLFGCDDNTGTLGMSMLPESDGISSHTTSFDVQTESVEAGAVFAKSSTGYVGRFSDPDFGYYETSFLTELNCTENFRFPEIYRYDAQTGTSSGLLAGDTVTGIQLVIFYNTWFGDSLNACRMSVYELQKRLDKNRYTNINPDEYYRPDGASPILLGRKAYTAYDATIPDSIRFGKDSNGYDLYSPHIVFPLDTALGNRILHENRQHPEKFADADAFIDNVFKGIYVKSDYGDGTILYIDQVALQIQFRIHVLDTLGVAYKKADGTDSLAYSTATAFASTKEVIQANRFTNSDKIKEKVAETGHTYIKSPAGIFTQATMPYDEIHRQLTNDTLNAVRLTFTNYQQKEENSFGMTAPTYVLLLRKQEVKEFFEDSKLPDNVTSYYVTHNATATNQYVFTNIARLVDTCINEKEAARKKAGSSWDEAQWMQENPDWDKVYLIPVTPTYDNSSSSPNLIGLQNDLKPGFAKLKGGPQGEALKLDVVYTEFNN